MIIEFPLLKKYNIFYLKKKNIILPSPEVLYINILFLKVIFKDSFITIVPLLLYLSKSSILYLGNKFLLFIE